MKRWIPFLLVFVIAQTTVFAAEERTPLQEPVAVMVAGEVDQAMVERARAWARDNLAIPVPLREGIAAGDLASFDDVAHKAGGLVASNQLGLVVLWMHDTPVDNHGAFFPEQKVVIVNMKAMLDAPDAETAARRVERQVIRGICLNMGLEPNPNPQSAMFGYSSREELDLIGRNLDPPWLLRLQEKALAHGIPVDQNNPFCMVLPVAGEPGTQE